MDNVDPAPEIPPDTGGTSSSAEPETKPPVTATTGRGQAFRNLVRELSDTDLLSPGSIKLLLELNNRAESECEELRGYVQRFHEADKRAAVFEEKLGAQKAVDILYTVGVAIGTLIVGLSVSLREPGYTVGAILLGLTLFGCSVWAKASRR